MIDKYVISQLVALEGGNTMDVIRLVGSERPVRVAWHKKPQLLSRCICIYCLRAETGESVDALSCLYLRRNPGTVSHVARRSKDD